jgi:hypothetical protein
MYKAFGTIPASSDMGRKRNEEFLPKDARITVIKVEFPTPPLWTRCARLSEIDRITAGVERFKVMLKYASLMMNHSCTSHR